MNGNFVYCNPTKLYFGEDSLDFLNEELPKYGKNVVLVYGAGSIKENGINDKVINILKKNVPKEGQIRLLLVTEKQYSKIEIIVGGVSNQEKTVNADSFIKL